MDRYQWLAKDMIRGEFAPAQFTHRDHVGVAFALLAELDFLEAAAVYGHAVQRFATLQGAPEKFNTTITLAFLSLVAERIEPDQNLDGLIDKNPDLLDRNILSHWYSADNLDTQAARERFVMPSAAESRAGIKTVGKQFAGN